MVHSLHGNGNCVLLENDREKYSCVQRLFIGAVAKLVFTNAYLVSVTVTHLKESLLRHEVLLHNEALWVLAPLYRKDNVIKYDDEN